MKRAKDGRSGVGASAGQTELRHLGTGEDPPSAGKAYPPDFKSSVAQWGAEADSGLRGSTVRSQDYVRTSLLLAAMRFFLPRLALALSPLVRVGT
jgi:hypothetical protein